MSQFHCGNVQGADAVGAPGVSAPAAHDASQAAIVEAARQVGETILRPNAAATDQGSRPNRDNMHALAAAGLLGMGLPVEWGGLAASGETQREVTETLASYCGVTTFTQAQHHGPSRMILGSPNETMKRCLLPELAAGRRMCAISFAHLRRPGPPVLRAEPTEGGYRLNGIAPWVTGWGLMDQGVFGATLPDERFVYLWLPANRGDYPDLFQEVAPADGTWGESAASEPLPLCAMNASATVELAFVNFFVPEAHRLHFSDRETMRCNDRNGVLGATSMPLGCTLGALRLLCETADRRGFAPIHRAASAFGRELEETRAEVLDWSKRTSEPEFFPHAVELRARVISLAVRAAHAAVTASSGAANNLMHPAQRLYREAMFYTIQAQTQEVMDATLTLLENSH